jgi:hypothetical protein
MDTVGNNGAERLVLFTLDGQRYALRLAASTLQNLHRPPPPGPVWGGG